MIRIDNKQHEFPIDDEASLLYVIPTGKALSLLFSRYSKDGKADPDMESGKDTKKVMAFMDEALEMFLVGWKGFLNSNDEEIPWDKPIKEGSENRDFIPYVTQLDFLKEVVTPSFSSAFEGVEELAKNLKAT